MEYIQVIIFIAQIIVLATGGCPHDETPKSSSQEVSEVVPQVSQEPPSVQCSDGC